MTDHSTEAARILVVDDEDTIRLVLARYLRTRGFEVATAESGDAALEALANQRFDLMLCDVRMPGMSGVEILPTALEMDPDLGIVMLSAVNDAPTATEALAHGVLDYLIKPVELKTLHEAVTRALQKRADRRGRGLLQQAARDSASDRGTRHDQEQDELRDATLRVLESVVRLWEEKDPFRRQHSARVADLAARMAEHLGLGPDVVEDVRAAALLHDIGNLGVPAELLSRPGTLEATEFLAVQEHVRMAQDVLRPLTFADRIVAFIGDHHERWDGQGYPQRRAGEHISIGGRILAAADAFVALTSPRAHRPAMERDRALEQLRRDSGSCFDPRVFEALRVTVKQPAPVST